MFSKRRVKNLFHNTVSFGPLPFLSLYIGTVNVLKIRTLKRLTKLHVQTV